MAGFVEGHSAEPVDPANEFTIPDDQEVFDGLPMGETFDQAAAKMRNGPAVAQTRPTQSELAATVRNVEPPLAARARPAPVTAAPEVTGEPTPLIRSPEPTPIMA